MPQDSAALLNKTDTETTGDDIKEIVGSPVDVEEPLVAEDAFEAQQSKAPIHKSIPLKFIIAGVASLLVLGPALWLFSGNLLSDDNTETTTDSSAVVETEETEEEKALRESELDNANLRRQLALQNQGFTAAELDQEAVQARQTSPTATPSSTTTAARSAPSAVSSPANIQTSRPAPQPVVSRPSAAPPVRTALRSPVSAPAPIAQIRTPAISRPSPPIDVAQLASNGSYGSLPQSQSAPFDADDSAAASSSVPQAITVAARTSTIPVSTKRSGSTAPVKSIEQTPENASKRPLPTVMQDFDSAAVSASSSSAEQPVELAASYEEESALIMGDTPAAEAALPQTIFAGSAAQGQINQPVSWAADMPSLQGSLLLTSPLVGGGYEVLPVGTEIIVEITSLSSSGAVKLTPTSIVLPDASSLHLSIPVEAVQVLSSDGGYPIAQIEDSSDAVLRRIDRQQAFLGAISGAGGFINRPNSESGFFGAGGSSYTRDYGDGGSVIAAVLQGAADEVLRGRAERLAAQADVLAARPVIWTLPAGTGVQVFINQEVVL